MTNHKPSMIGVDWGTTNFRAYLLDDHGAVLDQIQSATGILSINNDRFSEHLASSIDHWQQDHPSLPILLSGMITSRQGWIETPYLPCPAGPADLAASLTHHPWHSGKTLNFMPGLMFRDPGGDHDVMRGEETQIIGLIDQEFTGGHVVMPGTHSKWVTIEDGRVAGFATYMTGELFAVLSDHSILGRLIDDGPFDQPAFIAGIETAKRARSSGDALSHTLFGVRTRPLLGDLSNQATADYLSGLLIGHEVAAAAPGTGHAVRIVGTSDLAARYALALQQLAVPTIQVTGPSAAAGLWKVGQALKLE